MKIFYINSTEAYFTWTNPIGKFDYFLYSCSSFDGLISDIGVFKNNETNGKCANLKPSSSYELKMETLIQINETIMNNSISIYFNTSNFYILNRTAKSDLIINFL